MNFMYSILYLVSPAQWGGILPHHKLHELNSFIYNFVTVHGLQTEITFFQFLPIQNYLWLAPTLAPYFDMAHLAIWPQ